MATFIAQLVTRSGGSLPAPSRDWFPDDDGSVHEDSIDRLAEAGIVRGRDDGGYGPDLPVRRDAMAAFLVRSSSNGQGGSCEGRSGWFSDDDGDVHEARIDKAAGAGFTGGTAAGGYRPGCRCGATRWRRSCRGSWTCSWRRGTPGRRHRPESPFGAPVRSFRG